MKKALLFGLVLGLLPALAPLRAVADMPSGPPLFAPPLRLAQDKPSSDIAPKDMLPKDTPGSDKQPPEQQHQCPKSAYLNCMPIVPPERRAQCSKASIAWAQSHCPNFKVVY